MCNKRNSTKVCLKPCYCKVDSCLPNLLKNIEQTDMGDDNELITLGSCCGHGKYNMSIIVKDKYSPHPYELLSGKIIPRKRRFYKKDKQGYYYIPEIKKDGTK